MERDKKLTLTLPDSGVKLEKLHYLVCKRKIKYYI